MTHTFPVGTSEPQDFELQDKGVAINGTGLTLGLVIVNATTLVAPSTPPSVAWLNQAAGTVRVSGVNGLAVGSYYVRYSLTDAGGKVGYAPNGAKPDLWKVVTP